MEQKKIALITGGSRGIGLAIAAALAENGFSLAINGLRAKTAIENTLMALKKYGKEVLYCQGDISKKEDRMRILDKIQEYFGALHVLVNNAGIAPRERKDLLEASEESYDRVMSVNLKGPHFLTQAVAKWMIQQKGEKGGFEGCIINISSISAQVASINRGEYCLSKAGLSMATRLWASRLGPHQIPVYEVQPGIIQTDMTAGVKEKYDKAFEEGLCIQSRWGLSKDVGKAVAALATAAFPYSSGQVFMVDGGLTVPRL